LRELPDVAKRDRISPVATLMFSGTKRKKNFKRIISREIGLIMPGSELIQRHEYR